MKQHSSAARRRPRLRRAALVATTALAAGLALTACSSSSSGAEKASSGSSSSSSSIDLAQPGTLNVAILPTQRPTSYVENGKPMGMAIDFTDALAKEMGLKVKYTAVDLDSALSQITAGRYDTAAMGLVASADRKKMLDFSTPWVYGYYALLTDSKKGGSGKLADLSGKTVAVVTGSQEETLLKQDYPKITVRSFPDDTGSVSALIAGQVDGDLTGSNNVAAFTKQYPQLKASDSVPLPDPESYPIKKGNTSLSKALDAAIKAEMDNGTFNKLYAKWHPGEPFPTRLYKDYPDMPTYTKG